MAAPEHTQSWTARVKAFEATLADKGRGDLLPPLSLVRALLERSAALPDPTEVMALVGRVLGEVRECVRDRSRRVPVALVAELEAAIERVDEEAKRPDDWASGLLDGLGGADDGDLAVLTDSIRAATATKPKDDLGTLREPLSRVAAQSGDAAPRVLMKGELHPGLLADLIQLFAQNGETGLLFIEGTQASASVYFKEGVITDATCGDDSGEKGFFGSMQIREGRFSYQRGVEAPAVRIYRSAQHLIMDTLRMMDEAS